MAGYYCFMFLLAGAMHVTGSIVEPLKKKKKSLKTLSCFKSFKTFNFAGKKN